MAIRIHSTIGGKSVRTIVFHIDTGETIESSIDIPEGVILKGMNDFQVLGSAISYLRRYSISSILGIVSDKDTDASGEQMQAPKTSTQSQRVPAVMRSDSIRYDNS